MLTMLGASNCASRATVSDVRCARTTMLSSALMSGAAVISCWAVFPAATVTLRWLGDPPLGVTTSVYAPGGRSRKEYVPCASVCVFAPVSVICTRASATGCESRGRRTLPVKFPPSAAKAIVAKPWTKGIESKPTANVVCRTEFSQEDFLAGWQVEQRQEKREVCRVGVTKI